MSLNTSVLANLRTVTTLRKAMKLEVPYTVASQAITELKITENFKICYIFCNNYVCLTLPNIFCAGHIVENCIVSVNDMFNMRYYVSNNTDST